MGLKINYYVESLICRKSLLTHFQNMAKIMKEINFYTRSHSGHFEELNHLFKEMSAELHEIELFYDVSYQSIQHCGQQFLYHRYQRYLRSKC